MDDRWPQLIGLLLAGALVLLNLRTKLGGTPRGERLFKALLVIFLVVIAGAIFLLLRQGGPAPIEPAPAGAETVA